MLDHEQNHYSEHLFKTLFIWPHWIFIAVCGLPLVAASRGYSLVAVLGLVIAVASLVAECGL